MDSTKMAQVVATTIASLGEIELSGIKLESCDRKLLDVGELDLDRHVAMQPSAIAFFGALKKEALRRLSSLERQYDRWTKKKFAEAKLVVESTAAVRSTIKVEDVKARYIVDNETEIEKWERQIERLQEESDTLDVWFEAWKAKGFSIREHVSIDEAEGYSTASIRGGERSEGGELADPGRVGSRVRSIMQKRRESGQSTQ